MKWISVKDRLPEDGEYVVFPLFGGFEAGEYGKDWMGYWKNGEIDWWMPLPEPPQDEESEEE